MVVGCLGDPRWTIHAADAPTRDPLPDRALAVPGFEGWSVAILSPTPQFDPPFQLLLLAVLLGTAAVSIVWWLARQVVAPAEQLAQRSNRLGRL